MRSLQDLIEMERRGESYMNVIGEDFKPKHVLGYVFLGGDQEMLRDKEGAEESIELYFQNTAREEEYSKGVTPEYRRIFDKNEYESMRIEHDMKKTGKLSHSQNKAREQLLKKEVEQRKQNMIGMGSQVESSQTPVVDEKEEKRLKKLAKKQAKKDAKRKKKKKQKKLEKKQRKQARKREKEVKAKEKAEAKAEAEKAAKAESDAEAKVKAAATSTVRKKPAKKKVAKKKPVKKKAAKKKK